MEFCRPRWRGTLEPFVEGGVETIDDDPTFGGKPPQRGEALKSGLTD
jgi:hypothetical protein